MNYVSGPHLITAKVGGGQAVPLGTEDGLTILESPQTQDIMNDEFGGVPVDMVELGVITRLRLNYIDYTATKAVMYAGRTQGDPKAKVGTLSSAAMIEIVATPVAGTPAAADHGAITFYQCKVDGDFEILLGSRHTKGPLTLKCFPSATNANKTYSVAAAAGGGT